MAEGKVPLWAESSPTPGRLYGDAAPPRRVRQERAWLWALGRGELEDSLRNSSEVG